jgi:hypothetical protein
MITNMMKITSATLALVTLAAAGPVFASGSMGSSANTGMKLGQSVYARKIACKSCKFPGGLKGQGQVSSAISMIDNNQIMLSAAEAKAVKDYISKRFKGN